ncbi:PEGA domain-containing protein [Methanoregula sp.]|uniref:PEGA domain-containing protein n=1 Tax=Methanoregula sp. TaxID=2052170 RepID=UPI000CC4FEDF|nr:PEGA domain-containing protein [Methanoregula sp.]PKG33995.1 MAG: hypothetical protein CW742_00070 [Methanoregula sp.]
MSRILSLLILALTGIFLCIVSTGCIAPAIAEVGQEIANGTGSVAIVSYPPGAAVFINNTFWGYTPLTRESIPAGYYTIRLAKTGYESWSDSFFITGTMNETITANLRETNTCEAVTTTVSATFTHTVPEVYVDGYWEYPQGRITMENPVPMVIHIEASNIGTADARIVIVSANFYYHGRMVCWNTVSLGSLTSGGHVSRKSLVSCSLPLPVSEKDLDLRFENITVKE